MKKNSLLYAFITCFFLLTGCAKEVPANCINHIDSNHDGKCDVCQEEVKMEHLDSDHDGKCDVCDFAMEVNHIDANHDGKCDGCGQSVEVKHVDYNGDYYCDVCNKDTLNIDFTKFGWDANLARIFYIKLGIVPPYVPCISYKYEYGIDIFGDNYVNAYLFYSTEEIAAAAFNQYYNTCSDLDYEMQLGGLNIDSETYVDGIGYADKVLEGSKAVEITFLDSIYMGKDGSKKPALGIFVTNYLYIPEDVYPREAIEKAIPIHSNEIPDLLADDAEYYFYFGFTENEDEDGNVYVDSKYLEIHITSNDAFSLEETLFNELNASYYNDIYTDDENGDEILLDEYPLDYYGQEYWAYCFSKSGFINYIIQFGVSITSYGEIFLYFIIYYDIIF